MNVLLATLFLLATIAPTFAAEGPASVETSIVSTGISDEAEFKALVARVDEIKAMDKASLSSSEKQELRKELRITKAKVKAHGHGHGGTIVISGGLLLVILLLIILL
jgi:hypothetical protein